MTAYFLEVWDQFGDRLLFKAYTSHEKRLKGLADWCVSQGGDGPTDKDVIAEFFDACSDYRTERWEMEIE